MAARPNYVSELVAAGAHRSSKSLATALVNMIQRGDIPAGTRLPTVRGLADLMEVSPSTIANAWNELRSSGLIDTRRRGGTVVCSAREWAADLWGRNGAGPAVDLAQNSADPRLLPPLDKALLEGLKARDLHLPDHEHITRKLRDAVAPTWPFAPQAWSTGAGGAESAYLAFEASAPRGSKVAVEEPTTPRILDALVDLGFNPIAVPCDGEGPRVDGLAAAIDMGAKAFIYQPRAHLPLGHRVSPARIRALAEVLKAASRKVTIVEDDNAGPLAAEPAVSLGVYLPDQVIHVRAYCKAYGTDLKTAVIGGAADLVLRTRELRSGGRAVSSRILQDALAYLINDGRATRAIATARERYSQRHARMAEALTERGVKVLSGEGPVLWLPVNNESVAMVRLAANGITVGAGSRCFLASSRPDGHIRIGTSKLPDDLGQISRLADTIAEAVSGGSEKELY